MNRLKIFFIDRLWSEPDPQKLKTLIEDKLKREKDESINSYLRAMQLDVLQDETRKALEIFKSGISQNIFSHRTVKYRLAYLNARIGQKAEALGNLEGLNTKKAKIFRNCLDKIEGPFTLTQTMIKTAEKFGVHEQFSCLENLVKENNFKLGVEIGIFMGFHVCHLLEARRNLKMICVDLYANIEGNGYDDWTKEQFDDLFLKVKQKLDLFKRVEFKRAYSKDAASQYGDDYLDFVFIDADHRYEGVSSDIKIWEPKVKRGGIISGHDYDQPDWPGVRKAVDEWAKNTNRTIKTGPGNFWWTNK